MAWCIFAKYKIGIEREREEQFFITGTFKVLLKLIDWVYQSCIPGFFSIKCLSFCVLLVFIAIKDCSQAPTPRKTGIYYIRSHGSEPFPVYCDHTSDGGGT